MSLYYLAHKQLANDIYKNKHLNVTNAVWYRIYSMYRESTEQLIMQHSG